MLEPEEAPAHAEDQVPRPRVEFACWLSPSALLLLGALGGGGVEAPQVSLEADGESQHLTTRWLALGAAHAGAGATGALLLGKPHLQVALNGTGVLTIEAGDATLKLRLDELRGQLDDLETVARQGLSRFDASDRSRAVAFLATASNDVPRIETHVLSQRLHVVREALREHLPLGAPAEGQPRSIHLDRVLAVDDRCFYLEGWLNDPDREMVRLTAVSPEGSRAELLERMFRFVRRDVDEAFASRGPAMAAKRGFLCFIELDASSLLPEGWLVEMESATGAAVEVPGPPANADTLAVRDTILSGPFDPFPSDELMENHVHPAIKRIQERSTGAPKVQEIVQFGTAPDSAEVTVVVPVYERLDHLEMQLAEFADDPEISGADLVYVLDSPERSADFLAQAAQLAVLYRVPFRVGVLEQNVGFAGASNAGASLARGRLLLLLNSDTLPVGPGWLSTMREFYDSIPDIGALGPKLLYEDDSIQHAGMYFYQPPGTSVWVDAHYFKGMHRDLGAANVARPVPIVSGACLMIDRSIYEECGGLRDTYLRGDYEDSDLCLQLTERGRTNWYVPTVELYHLEGQSYSSNAHQAAGRAIVNRYNMWLHTRLWGESIRRLMENMDVSIVPGA